MRVLTDASKTLKKFESWVIIILATIDSIFRVLVLPSQNEKKKKKRGNVLYSNYKGRKKIKAKFLKVTPILFKQIGYRH